MALINCPECGKEISDRSYWCVHCGYPMREVFSPAVPVPEQPVKTEEPEKAAPITYVIKVTKFKSGKDGNTTEGTWPRSFPKIDQICPGGYWRTVRYFWENDGKSELFRKVTLFSYKKEKLGVCGVSGLNCLPGNEAIYIQLRGFSAGESNPSYIVLGEVDTLPEDRASYTGVSTSGAVKCPQCGSTSITTSSRGLNWSFGTIGAAETVNRCAVCGFTWYPRG